jgi:serpin B
MNLGKLIGSFVPGLLALTASAALAIEEPKPMPRQDTSTASTDLPAVVRGNAAFGLNLYARLRKAPGNTFLSPYSLSTALAMTAAGARGETARQMAEVLGLPADPARTNAAFAALVESLRPPGARPPYELHTANALWGQRGYRFREEFLATLRGSYRATFEAVDFEHATESARQTINASVEKETAGKIRDLIAAGVLDAQTRLVLTNAIYFKGSWSNPFRAEATREDDFHLPGNRTARMPLMNQTARFGYAEDQDCQVLELPYAGGDLAMVVLLPRKNDGLAELERSLSPEALARRLDQLQGTSVAVALPRFQLTATFELTRTLADLGMTLPFSDRADFSGINGGEEPLQISAVIHKAYVDVNETGTEAAAATAVGIRATAAFIPKPPVPFRADHPFVFLIRDRRTGCVLFLGCLTDPGR